MGEFEDIPGLTIKLNVLIRWRKGSVAHPMELKKNELLFPSNHGGSTFCV